MTAPSSTKGEFAVELKGLRKVFGEVVANSEIDLQVKRGSIHAVIGENGAGKSTAMKMLYGIYRPDAGEIFVDGKIRHWHSPHDAIAAGVGMVHQHFMLAGPYTVLENTVLGVETTRFGLIDFLSARKKLAELSKRHGLEVSLDSKIEDLSVGEQQRIEILKLLYQDAEILILDEPTAVLTPQETQDLFAQLKRLCAEGKTILIITHKLKEVMSLADRVTVFRAGRVVGQREIGETSVEDLAELMVGRKVNLQAEAPAPATLGAKVLELKNLEIRRDGRSHLHRVSFEVRAGEIVGIAGVEGNGQSELLHVLLHPEDYRSGLTGEICYFGKNANHFSASKIKEMGVGLIPEDRHEQGLLLDRPVSENFLLGLQRRKPFYVKGLVDHVALNAAATRAIEEYDVRPRSLDVQARGLSGGNQQKLIIAREFEIKPKLLIAAQPTRGVDVGAIEFIHKRILRARSEGAGVLLVSSELDEILALSDRILVIYSGKISAEFVRGKANERELGLFMGGAQA